MTYGDRIRQIRENKGLKGKYVAEKIGISQSQYCDLEKGRKKLTADLVVSLADAFGVRADDILRPRVSGTLSQTGTEG